MIAAELNIFDAVSFWGGVASIAALAITVVGGVVALYRMLSRSAQAELERLERAQRELVDRTRAATTQGKRMDLFIYQESMLSSLRFRLIILQISVAVSYILGLLSLIFVGTLDRNADYAVDHVFTFANNWRDHYSTMLFGIIVVVVFLMIDLHRRLQRQRRRLETLSATFISEMGKIVEAKLPTQESPDNNGDAREPR